MLLRSFTAAASLLVVMIVLGVAGAAAQSTRPVADSAAGNRPPDKPRVEIVLPTQHTQGINSVAFSADEDDRFVATSGDDGVIKLWDVATGRLIRNVARIDPNLKYWRVTEL